MQLQLNGFLLRKGMDPASSLTDAFYDDLKLFVWANDRLDDLDLTQENLLAAAVPGDIVVGTYEHTGNPAAWQVFVERNLHMQGFASSRTSRGAIIFCAMVDSEPTEEVRWLAWCFGACSKAIRRGASDPRFGLIAALNGLAQELNTASAAELAASVKKKRPTLRMLKYRTTAPYFQQTGHQASRNIPVEGFRVDKSADLISAVGGRVSDAIFKHVSGGRSINFTTDISHMDDFYALSIEVLYRSNVNIYKEAFGWVDNISIVEDQDAVLSLRTAVVEKLLLTPIPSEVDVLLPDDLPDMQAEYPIQYVLFPHERRRSASRLTLTVSTVSQYIKKRQQESTNPLDHELRFLDDSFELIGSASILECICADIVIAGLHYIAYDGDFYRVDPDFIAKVNKTLESVKVSSLPLPPYNGETEPSYNAKIKEKYTDEFVVLDGQLIRIPGESGVEPCDIVGAAGELIHVKRKGRSSTLSHLFAQAENSSTMLCRSHEARNQLAELVRDSSQSDELSSAISTAHSKLDTRENGIKVVFAILGDWKGRSLTNLPLFSRIGLGKAVDAISLLGYDVHVQLVDLRRAP